MLILYQAILCFRNFPYLIVEYFIKNYFFLMGSIQTKSKSFFLQVILIFLSLITTATTHAQQYVEDNLIRNCREAKNDSDYIVKMGWLSDYYYANKNFLKGDSVIEKQIMRAEATLNRNLILLAYFDNAGYRSTGTSTRSRSKNTETYIKRALEYAKANELNDYTALAWSNLAALNSSDGNLDEGFKNANLGFTTALTTNNDSAKVMCAIQLGNIYLQRSDILSAFKTYTNANNIAIQSKDELLLPPVLNAIASLYKKLGKDELAKNYLFRSLAINKKKKNFKGQVNDLIFLAKLSTYIAAKDHLQQSIQLADSIHSVPLKIEAQTILFKYMLLEEKPSFVLAYLEVQPELKNVFINTGPDYLNWQLAEIYMYGGETDSAIIYFRKAEASFNSGYDLTTKKNFFSEFAECLRDQNNIPAAISYFSKSFELSKQTSDLSGLKNNANNLKDLYHQQGDYKTAFEYAVQFDHYKDSADQLGKEKDLALLEIENETKQQQRDAELAAVKLERKYNLQYMLITVVVATAFVLLLMIGMFRVSTFTIRLLGFFSLIFLFEFIILVLDKWIHSITHGEPWKSWLIKIGIISALLPIHHFLEHRLIRYLLSHHLLKIRGKISSFTFFGKKKKPLPEQIPEGEVKDITNIEENI